MAPAPFDRSGNNDSISGEKYLTVRYEKLVTLLIEAVKELLTKFNGQQSQIDELKKIIEQLKK